MEGQLNYYDIYGFVIAVDEDMEKAFDLEYWRFKIKQSKRANLYVLKTKKKDLPIKLRQDTKGIYMPFNKGEKRVYYEEGVRPDWVLYSVEPMINWKDKCFLHCGAVSKDGEAILFPAEGGVGKTTMALHLITKQYEYLSDDWLIIGKDGKAYPFFKTLHLYDYNLKKDKKLAKRILGVRKYYYNLFWIYVSDFIPVFFRHRFFRIVAERLKPIFSVDVKKIHPDARLGNISRISKIYWMKKDKKIGKPILKKSNYQGIAEKMPYINALETNHFYKNYLEWAYNNPQNREIEDRIKKDKKIMKKAFKNAEIYELIVPDKINPSEVCKLLGIY